MTVVVSQAATCAVSEAGEVWCRDRFGVREIARDAAEVALGAGEVSVRGRDGAVRYGAIADPFVAASWPGMRARALAGPECVVRAVGGRGELVCRSDSAGGLEERPIAGPTDVIAATAQGQRVCVLDADHRVWCLRCDGWARRATQVRAAAGAVSIALGGAGEILFVDAAGVARSVAARGTGWAGASRALGIAGPALAVAAGASDGDWCALLERGAVECRGALALPAESAIESGATALVAGPHACVVRAGAVLCWGSNFDGPIAPAARSWIGPAPTGVTGATGLAVIDGGVCAGTETGTTCWGLTRDAPTLAGVGATWSSRPCVLAGGVAYCARAQSRAQIVRLEGLPAGLRELVVLDDAGCALDSAGSVHCFAESGGGVLEEEGIEVAIPRVRLSPTSMPWPEVSDIAASLSRICAVSERQTLCTDSLSLSHAAPPAVLGELEGARAIAIGTAWVCGATETAVRCRQDTYPAPTVASVGIAGARGLAMWATPHGETVCAVTAAGRVGCATLHPLGAVSEERELEGLDRVVEVAMVHGLDPIGCARREDGSVWCFGRATALGREVPGATPRVSSPRDPFAR